MSALQLFLSPLFAIPFLLQRPRLWPCLIAPVILNLSLLVLILAGLNEWLIDPLQDWVAEGDAMESEWLPWLVGAVAFLAALILFGFVAYFLFAVIASPFNDILGERIEHELLAERRELYAPDQTILASALHALKEAAQRTGVVLLILPIGLILGILPCIGPAAAGLFAFTTGVVFLTLDAFSYPLDRRRVSLRSKFDFLLERRSLWFFFGAGLVCLALIPGSLLFLPTLAATAATRHYCRIKLAQVSPSQGPNTLG
jgi:uncharacterized protein involved in cysteine biosynthesis